MSNKKIRPIAFYLPQFYPTPENDEWWEPGFTEWTNVTRTKPLFRGHYQPRLPRDLGFYDLRVPETRERQVQLAREAGIEGFCYWHYWFGNGKRLLADVFHEVVETGKPDFPFCLCWANHTWYRKTWDPTRPNALLIEQTYPGKEDYEAHFYEMLPAFKDKRYMTVDGKLIFGVFAPADIPDTRLFIDTWNELAQKNGLKGFYFFALSKTLQEIPRYENMYDAITYSALTDFYEHMRFPRIGQRLKRFYRVRLHRPYVKSYKHYARFALDAILNNPHYIPCIEPDFDHSPRSGVGGIVLNGSTPEEWGRLCCEVSEKMKQIGTPENLLFIKAWNEWGEGNYLEPDLRWGKAYIEEMSKVFVNS